MKINITLENKIRIMAIVVMVLLLVVFIFVRKNIIDHEHFKVVQSYKNIIQSLHANKFTENDLADYLKNYNFEIVKNTRYVLSNKRNRIIARKGYEVVIVNDRYYLNVKTPSYDILLKDTFHKLESNYFVYIVFLSLFVMLNIIFYLIFKNLQEKDLLIFSRQFFLRTVMHELKTPIAKGRIVTELIEEEKQKNRLVGIFGQLDYLINDFAKVEQVISHQYTLGFQDYNLETVVNKSIDSLMLDHTKDIDLKLHERLVFRADLELITMAIKNLIDNGLKYSSNKRIQIIQEENSLYFISKGNKLSQSLAAYFKPFHNEKNKSNQGMGLGLYIVTTIVDLHNFNLKYKYYSFKIW